MGRKRGEGTEAFLDTAFAIALSPSGDLYAQAFKLFSERTDKEWGLVDCVSFVVMRERGITDALTSDDHFRQAGFNALMRK